MPFANISVCNFLCRHLNFWDILLKIFPHSVKRCPYSEEIQRHLCSAWKINIAMVSFELMPCFFPSGAFSSIKTEEMFWRENKRSPLSFFRYTVGFNPFQVQVIAPSPPNSKNVLGELWFFVPVSECSVFPEECFKCQQHKLSHQL